MRCRLAQQVSNGRACHWSLAGLLESGVCPFVPLFPSQPHSPDLSCTFSCVKTRCDLSWPLIAADSQSEGSRFDSGAAHHSCWGKRRFQAGASPRTVGLRVVW